MSIRSNLGLCGLLCAGLLAVAGCSSADADANTVQGKYDTSSLDAYMSDVSDIMPLASSDYKPVASKFGSETQELQDKSDDSEGAHVEYDGFYGDWVAKIDISKEMDSYSSGDSADPAMAKLGEEMARAMVEAFGEMLAMSLSLNKDHTFEMEMMMMPMEGTWKQKGQNLILTLTKIMGLTRDTAGSFEPPDGVQMELSSEDFDEPLELRITEGGKALVAKDPISGGDQPLVFRRK